MKHKFLLSALTAIIVFAATTTAEAGIFGRLSVVWNGCSPCEPVACTPCEPVACDPCAVVECDPCANTCCDYGCRPFRPFGGLFANMKAKLAASHCCGPADCGACEPVACVPCEPVACDPCAVVECDPCAVACGDCAFRPFRPFGGFFANLGARLTATTACCAVDGCNPCDPVCDPCAACR